MPFFTPLIKPMPLPTIGEAIERSVMDWKARPATSQFEKAKDVTAFANHLGGCILIGASEKAGQLAAFVGLTPSEASAVRDDYSKAVTQRCQPPPTIEFEEFDDPSTPTKRIVAINVWPSMNLIGVRLSGDKAKEGYGGDAYVYPVRSGTDAMYLQPVQLPMFMTPEIRRMAVMLSRIPLGATVQLVESKFDGRKSDVAHVFDGVSEEENLAKFLMLDRSSSLHVPLDRILSVYKAQDSAWRVVTEFFR